MNEIILIVSGIIFLGFIAGINIYFSRRFTWYFGIRKRKRVTLAFASLTVFMIGGIIAFTNSMSLFGSLIYISASILMGITIYLIFSVLLVDLLHFFIKVQPKIYGIAAIAMAIFISVYGILNSYNLRTREITLPIKGLKREVRAMHLTDIHIGHFRGKSFKNYWRHKNRYYIQI